jgi:hypothetical protein
MSLEHEMETFRQHLPALLATDENRFVLVHGNEVAGTWPTKQEAVEESYRRFELEPFLVMRVVAYEKPIFVPREVVNLS